MEWTEADLIATWLAVAAKVPPPFALQGVTFHGPDHDPQWVAFAYSEELGQFGDEGVGATPIEALEALNAKLADRRR